MTTTQEVTTTFSTLGPIYVTRNGEEVGLGGEKQRAVLGILLARAGSAVDRDVLIEGVWGADASDSNVASLHTYVSNLRALTGLAITRSGSTYSLEVEPDEVDHLAFERLVEQSRALVTTDPADAAERLRTGLGWWNGRPYANVADCPGLQSEIRRLEELRIEAVELRIEADLAAGHHTKLISELEALVGEHPMRERFRAQQMLALYRAGRQSEALRAYRRACEYLSEEAGLEPSPELADLELKILQQDDSLLAGIGQSITERRAFLFTDIEGSTRLWDMHPDAMGRALNRHDEILRSAISAEVGKAFKHTGDGLLAAFPTVSAAVTAAESAQRALQAEDWGVLESMNVRMGIDVGDVDVRGDDFFGPPLNRCARIMSAGHGGQVLLSLSAQEDLTRSPIEGIQVRYLGEHRLRGLGEAERIGQLVFIGLPAEFPELRTHVAGPDPTGMESGDSLRGYELREQIGAGTFGVVYRAYQPSVGREVAIKVIRPEYANHPSFVRRFESEARLVAQLEHLHIVPLFDFWRDQDGAYLVMRLMRGGTLRPAMDGAWSPLDAVEVVRQVGGALGAAHRQGVVHRDFKPGNILLDDDGNAYLADFGIAARIMEPTEVGSLPTSAPRYRAPEETRGLPADQRSDVYSLAVLTYELLTGDRVTDRPAPVTDIRPDLPETLNGVIARATALNIEDRYGSVGAYLDALTEAAGDLVELPTEPPTRSETRNPFKGLRAFDESDRGDFFGRDSLVQTLVSAMQRRRFVTVVGPSGSGKSSVVRAGLLPRLRAGAIPGSDDWLYVTFTPGTHPFDSLADALQTVATEHLADLSERLAGDGLTGVASELLEGLEGNLMLILDQFEETFTLVDDNETRDQFMRILTESVETENSRVRVLATLRADFFDRPLSFEHIGSHVSEGHVTVIPPTRAELVEAIEKPALAVGLRLEPGLATRIAGDVAEQPGGLPLMQYALTELVDGRGTDVLTAADYEQIGGVTGALGRRAEQVFSGLPHSRQDAARQILLRLVTVDEHSDDTRRRAKRSELETLDLDPTAVTDVVDAFGRHRLLSFDRDAITRSPTVEVAHEALLREWPRLRTWIEDQREGLILGRRFQMAMSDWKVADRADDYLLTGDRLAPFAQWATTASLTADETSFLKASRQAEETARTARRRRRRILTGVLAGATAISLTFGAFALVQRSEAQDNAARAEQNAELADEAAAQAQENEALAEQRALEAQAATALAEARELAASAINVVEADPELATLLAIEAIDATAVGGQPVEVINALWRAGQQNRLIGVIEHGAGGKTHAALSTGANRLMVTSEEGAFVRVYEPDSLELIWEYREDSVDSFTFPSMLPDGSRMAVGVIDSSGLGAVRDIPAGVRDDFPNRILILDGATGALQKSLEFPECQSVEQSSWSPDGRLLVVGSGFDGCERNGARHWNEVYDTETWEPVAFLPSLVQGGPGDGSTLAHFDAEGRITTLTAGGPVQKYAAETFELSGTLDGINGLGDISPDGTLIVSDGAGGAAIFDATTGDVLDQLPIDESIAIPLGLAFSDDGGKVIVGTKGRYTTVFDVGTGERLFSLPGGQVNNPVFDAGTERLFTAHDDGTVKVWDLSSEAVGISPAGEPMASFIAQNRIHVGPDRGAFISYDFESGTPYIQFFDPVDGRLLDETLNGWLAVPLDDERFVYETFEGSWAFYEPTTGESRQILGCAPELYIECAEPGEPGRYYWVMTTAGAEELVAIPVSKSFETAGTLIRLSATDGAVLGEETIPAGFLSAFYAADSWVILGTSDQSIAVDRATGDRLWAGKTPISSGLSPSQRWLVFPTEGTGLRIVDTTTWSDIEIGDDFGNVRGISFSPDETKVALGNTDRLIIFDLVELATAQVLEIPEVQAMYWLDEQTIVIGTAKGVWGRVSLDTDEFLAEVRARLRRSLTEAECATYGIDPCPTLEEIQNR